MFSYLVLFTALRTSSVHFPTVLNLLTEFANLHNTEMVYEA